MKTLHKLLEDIEQRRQALKQRSTDAVSRYKQKSADSNQAAAKRRDELMAKTKKSASDALSRKRNQEQERAAARAAQQEKQDMKDDIKKELEAEREERKDDTEERMQDREKKRMSKERKREQVQKTLDSVG